jgi:hypothetical protein
MLICTSKGRFKKEALPLELQAFRLDHCSRYPKVQAVMRESLEITRNN